MDALGPRRRNRRAVVCNECQRSKLRCDRQIPCSTCKRRNRETSCSYKTSSEASRSTKTNNAPLGSEVLCSQSDTAPSPPALAADSGTGNTQHVQVSSALSLPESTSTSTYTEWETFLARPAPESNGHNTLSPLSIAPRIPLQAITAALPPRPCCDYLVSLYFINVSALFPILHGPTFQKQYTAFMQRPNEVELPWLALFLSMCSLALNTVDENDPRLISLGSPPVQTPQASKLPVTISMSRYFLRTAMTCLSQDDFLLRHRFSTFEALLMVIYNLSHNESLDQGWALLGMALNIGIALRCNVDQNSNPINTERRRRCWAGLLTLHTYQGILFRDVDMSFLLNIKAPLPADVNDANITDDGISQTQNHQGPTQMTMMRFKIRLFQLSVDICRHISSPSRLNQDSLRYFDQAIAEEQRQWDLMYTIDGFPNILNSTNYAHWCVLQTYAHHLYLLIHRPFSHSKSLPFLPDSQKRYIDSSTSLLSIHKQIFEAPLLRNYLWLLNGVTSLKALHAAVALNSCIQDLASVRNSGYDLERYALEIEGLATRMKSLSDRSDICFKGCRMIAHLQAQSREKDISEGNLISQSEETLEGWFDIRDWMDADPSIWNLEDPLD